ncbi:hypothetical protein KM043_002052 [Ampulex compressa]|nr:hypothetical protein KM043_002052 [Ampulex compressa]
MEDLMQQDLYAFIGAEPSATVQEIKKAYRKKALSCHPDKNPDNPRAAELFHQLSHVLEILTDTSARAAYDKVVAARHQAKLRVKEFDSKRKKLKDDLEAREEAYRRSLYTNGSSTNDERKLQAEIERLRKEGSKQVEEEVAAVKREIWNRLHKGLHQTDAEPGCYRVKIKWKVSQSDPLNGGYDYNTLYQMLSKYGDVTALVLSSKKGRALVEYQNKSDAEMAANTEIGLMQNPLILQKVWSTMDSTSSNTETTSSKTSHYNSIFLKNKNLDDKLYASSTTSFDTHRNAQESHMTDAEFEDSVLRNLRKAQRQKQLLEQANADNKV